MAEEPNNDRPYPHQAEPSTSLQPLQPGPPIAPPSKQPDSGRTMLLGLLAVAALIGILAIGPIKVRDQPAGEPTEGGALVACYEFVKRELKAPALAEFARGAESRIVDRGAGRYVVTSYVDDQNSFGGQSRNDFTCEVQHERRNSWQLVDLELVPR